MADITLLHKFKLDASFGQCLPVANIGLRSACMHVLPKINQWSIITLPRGTDVVDAEVLQQWLHLWTTKECLKTCYTYNTVYTNMYD